METFGNMLETGEGNNNTSPARVRIVPSKHWCFTFFFENAKEVETLETALNVKGIEYLMGEETCPTTGRKHMQGFISSDKKIRPIEKFKTKGVHWEKTKGNREQNIEYCSKEGKIKTNIKIPRKLIDPMEGLERKPWQKELEELFNGPYGSDRYLHWYWSKDGGVGKTSFCKHICMTRNAIVLSGKAADIKCGVAFHIEKHKELDIAMFHFTRSVEDYVSYEGLESIKDGFFFSGKFESGMCMFNQPHVVIFANFPPKLTDTVSIERWKITEITEKKEKEEFDEDEM